MSAYLDQKEIADAKFDSLTRAFVRNSKTHGVFETMRVDNSQGVHNKERHLARLLKGIESIQQASKALACLDLHYIERFFVQDTQFFLDQLSDNHSMSAVLRYQIVLDENNPEHITRMLKARSQQSISNNKLKIKICKTTLSKDMTKRGRKDIDRRVYDKAVKELNKTFYDGVLCDEGGYVIEGIKTNIFAVKNNNLYTPALVHAGVAGIMRQIFIERAQANGLNIIIAPLHYLDLLNMDAVFLSNSIMGVVNVDYVLPLDRKRSKAVTKLASSGFQNILKLNILKNGRSYKSIKS